MAFRLLHHLRTTLWPIPVLCVLIGLLISYATVRLDDGTIVPEHWTGGPDAALAILGTVAASMITLAGIVLTIVLVVVQLAMGQFSPRIVRAILHDRPSQFAIGIFVATFAHAMLAMREILSLEEGAAVPGLAIVVAFLLVVISIVALILYTNHIGQSLRVASLIETVGKDTRKLIEEMYPDRGPELDTGDREVVHADRSGVIFHVDHSALVAIAEEADCELAMMAEIGDFVPSGAPLFLVKNRCHALDHDRIRNAVSLGPERTLNQDLAYGLQLLVDIAVRSLGDTYDLTSAVQAIDRIHDILRQLARRPFPSGEFCDGEGTLRLVVPQVTWEGYIRVAFTQIIEIVDGSPQVIGRLKAVLKDLQTIAPPERQEVLNAQLERLAELDRGDAEIPADPQGIGAAPGLVAPRTPISVDDVR